jgi:hypothetical protein
MATRDASRSFQVLSAICVLLSAALLIMFRVMHRGSDTQLQALVFGSSRLGSPGIVLAAMGFSFSFSFRGRKRIGAVFLSLLVLTFWF